MLKYNLCNDDSLQKGLNEAFLNLLAGEVSRELNLKESLFVEIDFVDRKEIQRLNKTYRGIDKETDVLSFEIHNESIAGQIFICYDIALEQAISYKWSLENELALLIIHGTLHIFGFDHEKTEETKAMIKKENSILRELNLKEYEAEVS